MSESAPYAIPRDGRGRALAVLAAVVLAVLLASGLAPYDRGTWVLETFPVMIALPLLVATWRRFPLTTLLYALIAAHALVLIAGGIYTYARVPLGFWLQALLGLARNPYDKLGHFMQGLVPALLAREVLLAGGYLRRGRMLGFLALCCAMTVSACYELIEWAAAVALGQGAYEFLGTQGDIWDTQSDMLFALIGASFAMLFLAGLQDRGLRALGRLR